jgi:hypothetical protein
MCYHFFQKKKMNPQQKENVILSAKSEQPNKNVSKNPKALNKIQDVIILFI